MNKLEEAAKAYQEKEQSMWTGKGMAKDFQDAFMAGAEWQRKQKPDFRKLWEQSIQLPELHTFDDAPAKCPEGYRPPTREEQDWLLDNTEYSFDKEAKEGVFRFADGFELRLPASGYRGNDGTSYDQGMAGYYWSSSPRGTDASYVGFGGSTVTVNISHRANALSVRCVPTNIR